MSKEVKVYYVGEAFEKALEEFNDKTVCLGNYKIAWCGITFRFEKYTLQNNLSEDCFVTSTYSRLLNYPANESKFSINFSEYSIPYFDENYGGDYNEATQRKELIYLTLSFLTARLFGDTEPKVFDEALENLQWLFSFNRNKERFVKASDLNGNSAFEKLMEYLSV